MCLVAIAGGACAGPDSTSSTTAATSGELVDVTAFEVEWAEQAVVLLDTEAVAAALVSADHADGRFVFDADYDDLDQLDVGRATLLAGLGVYRVTGRQDTAQGVEITVEPGVLTDVIENGRITFTSEVMAHPDEWETVESSDAEATSRAPIGAAPTASVLLVAAPALPQAANLNYSGTISGFDTTFKVNSRDAGGFDFSLTAKRGAGNNVANVAMTGSVSGLRVETDILIEASSLQVFDVRLLNVEGNVEIHGGGAQIGIFNVPLKIPVKLAIPIPVGPLPFYISISGGLEFESTLGTSTTALVKGTTSFKGGVGAAVNNGAVRHLATFDVADLTWEPPDHVGTVTSGIGLLLDFPKIEFGLGHPSVAGLGAEFKFRSEIVSNFELEYGTAGNFPVITGNCAKTKVNFGATVTGAVRMLGVTLATDPVTLYSKLGEATHLGSAC